MQKLAAFLTYHGDVEGDVQNLFQTLRECMIPWNSLTRSKKKVYKCVRPLHLGILTGLMPIRIFEPTASRKFTANLDGICAQRTEVMYSYDGRRLNEYAPVSSSKYKELMTKVGKGEVDIANYTSARLGGVNKVITMKHLQEQRQLGIGVPVLYNRLRHIMASNATVERRMQAIIQAMSQILPATTAPMHRLSVTLVHQYARETAAGGSKERFLDYLRIRKLQCLLDGGFRIAVNNSNLIVVNCNEMVRGSLQGQWVDQASRFRCSLVTAGSGGIQVRKLATKAEVFNTIRTGSAEWSEDALHVLDDF